MNWMQTRVALLLAALAASGALPAAGHEPTALLQGKYQFREYGSAEGLANLGVLHMLQDRAGFIWVGTDDGLYRYDGYRFDAFGLDHGLLSTAIDSMHEDRAGRLWVGSHAGLGLWNGDRFEPRHVAHGLPEGAIVSIADLNGSTWAATTSGPYRTDRQGRFGLAAGWPGGEATALCAGKTGMWAAQWQGEAVVWQWRKDGWHRYENLPAQPNERIDAIVEDGQGQAFARSARGLWALAPGAAAFQQLETPRPLIALRGYLKLARNGKLWVPTDDAGLLSVQDGEWRNESPKQFGSSRAILEDAEGSLWFGTTGLRRLLGRGLFHAYGKDQGSSGIVPWVIFRDRQERLWVGTSQGLARQVGEQFASVPGTEAYTIRSMVEAPDGTFYMAGVPASDILHFDPETQTIEIHRLAHDNPAKRIYRLLLDERGVLWAGTEGAGVLSASIHAQRLQFSRVGLPNGATTEGVSDLHQDGSGRLWLAGQHGLAMREADRWRRFTTQDGLRDNSIAYVRTTANGDLLIVYFEPRGFTRARYERGNLRVIEHYDSKSHAIADKIFIIGEDSRQRLWIGGGRGVDFLGPAGTEHFGIRDGLVGEDTASMAFRAEPNGDVWIGAVGGLVRFDARRYDSLPPRTPPATSLLSVTLAGRNYNREASGIEVLSRDNSFAARYAGMSYLAEGTMRYRMRLHGLESASSISDSREARYTALPPGAYRFEVAAQAGPHGAWGAPSGFSFSILPAWWQTWWFRTCIALLAGMLLAFGVRWRLAALSAKNRLLEKHVADRTMELSDANTALHHVNSRLQDQIEERFAAESAVQERNAQLQALNEKLADTQSQLLQSEKMACVGQLAAGVAHEINNPVGYVYSNFCSLDLYMKDLFVLLRIYETLEKAMPADHPELHRLTELKTAIDFDYVVSDASSLIGESRQGLERIQKIVKDLKDFSHVDEPLWQLADIHEGIESTLNVIAHEIKYKVHLVKEYGNLPRIRCLPFQLNQVFLNLLINASHSIAEQGRITIQTGCDDERVWIRIADTGEGISEANLKRIFEPFFTTKPIGVGTGLGLSLSWGIVNAHGGSIEVQSQPGEGTAFTVFLPIASPAEVVAERAAETGEIRGQ